MQRASVALLRYGVAVLAVLTAYAGVRLEPALAQIPYVPFFAAVLASAWLGGLRPGLIAIVLSFLIVYLLVLPFEPGSLVNVSAPLRATLFLAIALLATLLGTFRFRWQQRLEHQAEVLREADRRKDEFLAILAHELRNGLAPIRNALEVMRLRGSDRREAVHWAQGVLDRQIRQLGRLVDDLLDVSRIARGKFLLTREPVDLAKVVASAVEISRPVLGAHHHLLAATLPPEPLWLEGDPGRLTQVLVNLLTNAARYTPDRGRIVLSAQRENDQVVVRVRDNGIGIAPEVLPRIFDLFTQGQSVPGRDQAGLGIGLTLVRSLVQMHGGTVEARSEGLNRGSEFILRFLPRTGPEPTPAGECRPAHQVPVVARHILVVDDNVDAAEGLSLLLRLSGHEVWTAHDGPSALQLARTARPEVVLMDIGLPGMDGHEVARKLRQEAAMAKALLVALTGYGQDEDRRRSAEAGFDLHLVKPVDPEEIARALTLLPPRTPV